VTHTSSKPVKARVAGCVAVQLWEGSVGQRGAGQGSVAGNVSGNFTGEEFLLALLLAEQLGSTE